MPMHSRSVLPSLIAAACLVTAMPAYAQQQASGSEFGLGRAPTQAEIDGWNIDARPSGVGLPQGSGSASQGEKIYAERCVACHGEKGEGPMDRLAGGVGSLASDKPVKTVGSYWPFAAPLYDYISRAMPFDHPQTMSNDDVYAVAAYVLFLNDLVAKDTVMDAGTLAKVKMPNRDGFYGPDPRPDVHNLACMRNCEPLQLNDAPRSIPPSRSQ